MQGTWQTTGGGGGIGLPRGLIGLGVVVGAVVGTGLAVYNFVMSILPLIFIGALVLVLGAVAFVLRRRMTGRPLLNLAPLVQFRELDLPQGQPFILGAPKPQALPQVTNNYFIGGQHVHGVDGLPVVRGELVPSDDN